MAEDVGPGLIPPVGDTINGSIRVCNRCLLHIEAAHTGLARGGQALIQASADGTHRAIRSGEGVCPVGRDLRPGARLRAIPLLHGRAITEQIALATGFSGGGAIRALLLSIPHFPFEAAALITGAAAPRFTVGRLSHLPTGPCPGTAPFHILTEFRHSGAGETPSPGGSASPVDPGPIIGNVRRSGRRRP